MSSNQFKLLSEKQSKNLAQIIQNFFTKAAQTIVEARDCSFTVGRPVEESQLTPPTPPDASDGSMPSAANRWFNIDLAGSKKKQYPESLMAELSLWRTRDVLLLPPLVVETVLDLRGLEANQTLVFEKENMLKTAKKSEIVLERWLVEFDMSIFDNQSVEVPGIYKRLVVLFRVLYTVLRLLPAYQLRNSLLESGQSALSVCVRAKILDGSKKIGSKGRIGLSRDLGRGSPGTGRSHLSTYLMQPVLTPIGALKVSASYRTSCDFAVRDNEELISDQLLGEAPRSRSPSSPGSVPRSRRQLSTTGTGQLPRRRSSVRSVPLFKVGSVASSSSQHQQQALVHARPSVSPRRHGPRGNGSFDSGLVANLSSNSLASFVSMRERGDFTSTKKEILNIPPEKSLPTQNVPTQNAPTQNPPPQNSQKQNSFSRSFSPSSNNYTADASIGVVASLPAKFASSFGSRFRTSIGSRQGSADNLASANPALQNFRMHARSIDSVGSEQDPSNSLYMDEDLEGFVKMLDSKPSLRLGATDEKSASRIYGESLREFKQLQKSNELFSEREAEEVGANPGQKDPFIRKGTPVPVTPHLKGTPVPISPHPRGTALPANRRASSSSSYSYSPSFQFMKLASSSGPSNPTVTPAVGYAGRFSSSPQTDPPFAAVGQMLRRSSAASSYSAQHQGSAGDPISRNTSFSRLPHELDPEALKLRSYKEQVFVSDDEDSDDLKDGRRPSASKNMQAILYNRRRQDDDEDELMFAMSDMTLARNNLDF
ncbi:hypothetical protein BRETT_003525 [Brettanomyces bruxellensis]|uniref:Autophagy-related protein 13 n=1 Tax=Dekkera bruxellensis TaxID=5007 RepID=A0A871R6L2_DEKBR|nr:uncharacterized protein BRETT_003525 [Brettanomyces bruxellensis]QOU19378.1 hypothetical protein BRETT_003525 [Brettanomyces bruxellensis]